jgi:hypothetical protein
MKKKSLKWQKREARGTHTPEILSLRHFQVQINHYCSSTNVEALLSAGEGFSHCPLCFVAHTKPSEFPAPFFGLLKAQPGSYSGLGTSIKMVDVSWPEYHIVSRASV